MDPPGAVDDEVRADLRRLSQLGVGGVGVEVLNALEYESEAVKWITTTFGRAAAPG